MNSGEIELWDQSNLPPIIIASSKEWYKKKKREIKDTNRLTVDTWESKSP